MTCPCCNATEVEADTPRTVYACGSSDYDQRPGTFLQSLECRGENVVDFPAVLVTFDGYYFHGPALCEKCAFRACVGRLSALPRVECRWVGENKPACDDFAPVDMVDVGPDADGEALNKRANFRAMWPEMVEVLR
jgi:hypothetical protein